MNKKLLSILSILFFLLVVFNFQQTVFAQTIPPAQNLGDLIEDIFRWALALVGIAVFINFLWAGILWFSAAGRPGPITQAKEKMFNALIGFIILLAAYLILNTINPELVKNAFTLPGLETQPPPENGDGGGRCTDTGNGSPDYEGALRSAITAVINANPEGIADKLNTTDNSFRFLNFVATELQGAEYNATTNVLNGHDKPNTGDLIAVWRSGDATIERYDAVADAGLGNEPLKIKWTTQYTGDIPLSCASGG